MAYKWPFKFQQLFFYLKNKVSTTSQWAINGKGISMRVPSARNLNLKFLKVFQTITSKFHALHKIFDTDWCRGIELVPVPS